MTGFNKENNVELYVYGGGNISTSTMNEILTNTPRQFSSPEVSASMIAIYGDDIFVNPDKYQGGFQTGSVTIGYVKNSFATDLEGHINVIGVGGSFGGPIGGSAGLVTYTRVPQEKIFKHFSSEYLDKAYNQVVNGIKGK